MLLRFGVENHLSIREKQELSFAASSLKERRDGLIRCEVADSGAVVPAAVVYGANASGKTNLVDAASTMKRLVLGSHAKGEPGGGVPRRAFLLDPGWSRKPSRFEIDFVSNDVRYHYGFEADDEAFVSEWLYEFPKSHRRKMFERNEQNFEFGRWLRGGNKNISLLTRSNSLFLSAAAQNGHAQLSRIYEYFQEMTFSGSISVPGSVVSTRIAREGLDVRVIDFLEAVDTRVVGHRKTESEIPEEYRSVFREVSRVFEKISGKKINPEPENFAIQLSHRGKGGEEIHLDLDLESAGTRRLLIILSQALKALDGGSPLFIDELDVSLHTRASEAILKLFCSPETNRSGAQVIATTHDTNLMKSDVLRRDQVWFAEKNPGGATEIYPLTDIRTRKGDNVELGYLQGRYGALPSGDPLVALTESR